MQSLCPFRQLANMKFSLCVPLGNWLTWMLHHTTDLDFPNHGPSCSLLLKHQLVKPVTCLEAKSSGFTAEDGWMLSLQKKCIHDPWIWKRKGCGRRCLLCMGIIKLLSFHHNRRQQNVSEISFTEWILLYSSLLFPKCQGNKINHCTAISSHEAGLVSSTSEHIHSVSVSVCMFLGLCCFYVVVVVF